MNRWRVLLIKFVMTFIIAMLAFSFLDLNPAGWVLFVAVAVTIVSYLVGDQYLLSNYNNIVASVGNGVLGIIVAYIVGLMTAAFNPTAGALFTFAILLAVGEYFFHTLVLRSEGEVMAGGDQFVNEGTYSEPGAGEGGEQRQNEGPTEHGEQGEHGDQGNQGQQDEEQNQ